MYPLPSWLRHCLGLVSSTAFLAETLPLPCVFHLPLAPVRPGRATTALLIGAVCIAMLPLFAGFSIENTRECGMESSHGKRRSTAIASSACHLFGCAGATAYPFSSFRL